MEWRCSRCNPCAGPKGRPGVAPALEGRAVGAQAVPVEPAAFVHQCLVGRGGAGAEERAQQGK